MHTRIPIPQDNDTPTPSFKKQSNMSDQEQEPDITGGKEEVEEEEVEEEAVGKS